MSLVLVVSPRPEREVAALRRRLGAVAAVVGDPSPDQQTRAHADLLVLVGVPWAEARGWLGAWRADGLESVVVLALTDAPREAETRELGPLVLTAPVFLDEAVSAALSSRHSARLQLRCCEVDLVRRTVLRDGELRTLTAQEARLLSWLATRPGQDITREDLLRGVWGYPRSVPTRAVDMAVFRLRKKIERDPSNPDHLQSSRGDGYRYMPCEAPTTAPVPPVDQPLTAFFGRADELAELGAMAASGRRLVALIGPPGVGKSRLARERLRRVGAGSLWCEQGQARDPLELLSALAGALGLSIAGMGSAEVQRGVGEALAGRDTALLVLDSIDHIIDDIGPILAALLQAAPRLQVLTTSRARPALPGAAVRELAPLPADDARALFLDRAEAAGWAAPPGDAALAEVDALVEVLDRVPLALELAAARTRALSLADLRAHIQLDLLATGASRGELRPLRGALAWSWSLLSPAARSTLAQLSVFEGGFSLAAAEGVVDRSPGPVASMLADLVDHSLVLRIPEGGRYRLLWHVRAYAADEGGPELLAAARDRHGRWMAGLARAQLDRVRGPGAPDALEILRSEQANLRAALEHLRGGSSGPAALVDLTEGLDLVWSAVGTMEQRLALWDSSLLSLPDPSAARGRALASRGRVRHQMGLSEGSDADLREAVGLLAEHGELTLLCQALFTQVGTLRRRGRLAEAQEVVRQLVAAAAEDPSLRALAEVEDAFLICLRGPDRARQAAARRRLTRAARLLVTVGEHGFAAHAWLLLLTAHELGGEVDQALVASEQLGPLAASRPTPEIRRTWAYQRVVLDLLIGRYASAEEGARAVLEQSRAQGLRNLVCMSFSALASALHGLGRLSEAMEVWEAALAEASVARAPRLALSARAGLALLALEEGRSDDAEELIVEGQRQATAMDLGRVVASYQLLGALALRRRGELQAAQALLDTINAAALRPEQQAARALLQVGGARSSGLPDAEARAVLSACAEGPSFAGKQALSSVLAAIDAGDLGALSLYSMPPAPPLLRVVVASMRAWMDRASAADKSS